ncbi:hypothetical protein [Brevundimonas sp. DC300-4]|uniref:hypothetical protein n=1 Tax=Brevundimonas sp. DC300-4 TaxID=2804594 RepID=UPI003CEC12F9
MSYQLYFDSGPLLEGTGVRFDEGIDADAWWSELFGSLDQYNQGRAQGFSLQNGCNHGGHFGEAGPEALFLDGQIPALSCRMGVLARGDRQVQSQQQIDCVSWRHVGSAPSASTGGQQGRLALTQDAGRMTDRRSVVAGMKNFKGRDQGWQLRHRYGSPLASPTLRFHAITPETGVTTGLSHDASG